MKTKNLLNKTKILLGAGILTVGAATSIFLACKYLGNKQFQYYDFGKFTWSASTTSQDVIDAINNNEMLQSYKNESIEFLKSKIYTHDLRILCLSNEESINDAYTQAQAYGKEFYRILEKYYDEQYFNTQKNSLTSPFVNVYSELMQLNTEYGIDPIDYYQLQNILLPQMEENILYNASPDSKQKFSRKINLLENQLEEQKIQKHLDSFHLNRMLAAALNDEGLTDEKDMELVASQVAKMLANRTLILNENPDIDFVSLLAPYSLDGKNGYSDKDKQNILSQDDLNKLFLAKRDYLGNSELLSPNESSQSEISNDDTKPVKEEYLPLDAYVPKTEGLSSFAKNEIIPGYTLQAKIISIDYASDSNAAKVDFQIGISKTSDLKSDVSWISSESNDKAENGYLPGTFKVSSFEQKLNCANTFFYPQELKVEYKNGNFDATKISQRITITNLLRDAPYDSDDHYTFSEENPYIVDTDNLQLPGVVKPQQLENNHANEKIMLAITKANTNFAKNGTVDELLDNRELVENSSNAYRFQNLIPFVEAKWVLTDTNPNSDEYKIIKEYKWANSANNQESNALPLYFPYSSEELNLLQEGNTIAKLVSDFYTLSYDEKGNERNVAKDIYDNMDLVSGIDEALAGLLIGSSAVNDICSLMSAVGLLSVGFSVAGTVLDGVLAYNGVKTAEAKRDMLPAVKELVELVNKFKSVVPKNVAKAYAEFYQKLNDETITVDAKLKIARTAKFYIFIFDKMIFDFFDYGAKLTNNEEIIKQEKTWSEGLKKDSLKIKDMVLDFMKEKNPKQRDEYDFDQEFLNYHNDDVIAAYKLLDVSDTKDNIQNINDEVITSFLTQHGWFALYGIGVVGGILGGRALNLVGTQFFLWKNIGIKDHVAYKINYSDQSTLIGHWRVETTSFIQSTKVPIPRENMTYKLLDGTIVKQTDIDKMVVNAQKYETKYRNSKGWAKKMENYKGNIASEKEFSKYMKRQSLNPSVGRAALVFGTISLVVGVAQMLMDELAPSVPKDKAWIIQQMQSEL